MCVCVFVSTCKGALLHTMPSTEGTEGVTCEKKCTGETNTLRSRRLSAHQLLVVKKHTYIYWLSRQTWPLFSLSTTFAQLVIKLETAREREGEKERERDVTEKKYL